MPSLREAQLRYANYYEHILRKADDLYLRGGDSLKQGLELFDLNWDNIQAGRTWAEANREINRRALELCCNYPVGGLNVLFLRRNSKELIQWLQSGINAARILSDQAKESMQLSVLSAVYLNLGDTEHAIESGEQALAIVDEISSSYGKATVLMNLGDVCLDKRDFRRSVELYEQAFDIFHKGAHLREQGVALGKLGLVQKHLGVPRSAIRYYRRQLKIARKIGDYQSEQAALANLGTAYVDIGKKDQAAQFFDQALKSAQAIGDLRGRGSILFNSALAHKDIGQNTLAITYAQASLKLLEQAEDFMRADGVRKKLAEWHREK